MIIKMKTSLVGATGNGETTMLYEAGKEYTMKTKLEMEMATVWCNDGRADKSTGEKKVTKVANDMEKKVEKKSKGILKKVFGKKK